VLVLLDSSVGAEFGIHLSGLQVARLGNLVVCSAVQHTERADKPFGHAKKYIFVMLQGVCMQAAAAFRQLTRNVALTQRKFTCCARAAIGSRLFTDAALTLGWLSP
jgi:hypothetical protein